MEILKQPTRSVLNLHAAAAAIQIMIVLFAVGCATQTTDTAPPLEVPDAFSDSGTQKPPDHWWTAFGCPELNALLDQALADNFDLKTGWQRLKEARAIAEREASALFPELEAFAEGEVTRSETIDTEQLRLGLTAAFEVDLWGRIRSSVQAEEYRAKASLADYQTAALSVSGEVVRTWYQLMAAQNQLRILSRQIEANQKVLRLLKDRFAGGQTRSVDILRQRQLVEATREQRFSVESRIQVAKHQLSVLAGNPPRTPFQYTHTSLPELPPLPETGLPSALVRRRPDVKRAHLRLRAADRDMAAAVSNQYPRLDLTAALSSTTQGANDLFEDWARSFSANLVGPLFDAGRRSAEVDRAEAVKNQRLYTYGQTILTAFQEVEDALIREKKQTDRIKSLESQVRLAEKTYKQLRLEYVNGVSDFIDVLTALTAAQQLRRDLVSAELTRIEYRIALHRALAGGFDPPVTEEKEN